MAKIKVQLASRFAPLDAGATFAGGYTIAWTVPGGEHALVEVPDHWTPEQVDALVHDWERRGLVVDDGRGLWRSEYTDYRPVDMLGKNYTLDVSPRLSPGDTFGLLGISEAIRRRGGWGVGALIGVCDTGIDAAHPWFSGKSVEGDRSDSHGHGSHVCGVIAGSEGIASDAALLVFNVLPGGQGSESQIAAGIRACADQGCVVLNLSLGGSGSQIMDDACNYAKARGCVVVAAAGNGGGAPIGSPARAADLIVMAYDRNRQWASFTDGRQWNNANRTGAPGVDIVSAAPGGGLRQMSGTSMAAPHITGAVTLLRAAGLDRNAAVGYILGHRGAAPDGLACTLAADFGEGGGEQPAPGPDTRIADLAAETIRVLDEARYVTRATDNERAWSQVGSIADYLTEIAELSQSPKVPPGPGTDPPSPTRLRSIYGTYTGHGLAVDAYPGRTDDEVQFGPHHGLPLVAPADGRVEVYAFGTPLDIPHPVKALETRYSPQWHALNDGWTCRAHPLQTMYVAVWYPSGPYSVEGQRVGHLHYGHVRSDIKAGPIRKGEQFATVWDSGVRWEPGLDTRAAHVHCAAGAGTQLSPNGDLPGRLAVLAQGWDVTDVGAVPGPSEYQSGAYCAGRLLSDFTRAGKPIPPLPS